ncbi:hypothetical protein PPTG_24730 [Phytophthora nicotianae INRA-310]|uniref:Uncharacterized protein n=1 Tax=Phytophthora nicotianae (strain INRA-310) TaxID=761204 RepID=W2PCY6_PHYN3|nr:hypothetical protein PPTG_24730 [Phytophthora nicotianae INRA-310]ETM98083.1 hypothetical protein PPTG_24730 [Phytophthora nicotianae INRA-310]
MRCTKLSRVKSSGFLSSPPSRRGKTMTKSWSYSVLSLLVERGTDDCALCMELNSMSTAVCAAGEENASYASEDDGIARVLSALRCKSESEHRGAGPLRYNNCDAKKVHALKRQMPLTCDNNR